MFELLASGADLPGGGTPWELPDKKARSKLFKSIAAGDSKITMSEFDAGILRHVKELRHKPSLRRAFLAADSNDDGVIKRSEFKRLLEFTVFFNKMAHVFDVIDADKDGRLERREFNAACRLLGTLGGTPEEQELELEKAFLAIDVDRGGHIRFSEFCDWAAARYTEAQRAADGEDGSPSPPARRRKSRRRKRQGASPSVPASCPIPTSYGAPQADPWPRRTCTLLAAVSSRSNPTTFSSPRLNSTTCESWRAHIGTPP